MNFTAIDFETANNKRTSACALGLVKIENCVITKSVNYLFKPIPFYFTNSHIHNIYEEDVINKPYFVDCWNEIQDIIGDDLIIAHNAAFDLSVLRSLLEHEKIEFPNLKYVCTWRLSEKYFELKNYKLPTISNHLNISLNHHEALSDAVACAKIAIELLKLNDCNCLQELSNQFQIGELYHPFDYRPFSSSFRNSKSSKKNIVSLSTPTENPFKKLLDNTSNKLNGLTIVYSGMFEWFERDELKKLIEQNGGKNTTSISKKTSYLVAGENMGPSKREKANNLEVSIISEDEFIALLK